MHPPLERDATELLRGLNALGGYLLSLVCTADGLLVASAGERVRTEVVAGLTSLFHDIALRAARDLELARIDELTLLDRDSGCFVVRPLDLAGGPPLFLVVQVPRDRAWRRNTTLVARQLRAILRPLVTPPQDPA
jgi:hypothetical protein